MSDNRASRRPSRDAAANTVAPVVRVDSRALERADAPGVTRVTVGVMPTAAVGSPYPIELPDEQPLHVTRRLALLCRDIATRMPAFFHVNMDRVLVAFAPSVGSPYWGKQATLVPLRFRGGRRVAVRRGHRYRIQRILVGGVEQRYVLLVHLPRFFNQSFDEKMITVFHELYHVAPEFSGDVRRFGRGRSTHDGSQRDYDLLMSQHARAYLAEKPPRVLVDFLRLSAAELEDRCGSLVGLSIPHPKLLPIGPARQRGRR